MVNNRWRNLATVAPGRYRWLKTLANEWEVWAVGPATPINRVVLWGPWGAQGGSPVSGMHPVEGWSSPLFGPFSSIA
jgi:hypothetical protein